MKPISFLQAIGLAWFVASIVLEIGTTIYFMLWLRRRGIRLTFGLTGIPGYLEMHYMNLCRQQKRSAKTILTLRLILLINVFLAAIIVVSLVIMS
jgi:hypothetical protein